MIELLHEAMNQALQEIQEKREAIIHKAIDHFQVNTEDIPDRVRWFQLGSGVDSVEIDGVRVLTFMPLRVDENKNPVFDYREHYLEKRNEKTR
jgi:hypothetical protein